MERKGCHLSRKASLFCAREGVRYVINHCGRVIEIATPVDSPVKDPRLLFLGDDAAGVALEVMAVEVRPSLLSIIHAMRLRKKYETEYQEAKRWQRT